MVTVPTQFSPNSFDYFGGPLHEIRTISYSSDGLTGYFWGNAAGPTFDYTFTLIKCSFLSPTVLATGPAYNYLTYGIPPNAPPTASWTGTKLWFCGFDPSSSGATGATISMDPVTLSIVDVWVASGGGFSPNDIQQTLCLNLAGTFAIANNFSSGEGGPCKMHLVNLVNGADNYVDIYSVSGGPTTSTITGYGCFDNSGRWWCFDSDGKFWRFTVTTSGTPDLSSPISFTTSVTTGEPGILSFNPDTGVMTAWSPSAFSDNATAEVVTIDTATNTVGTVYMCPAGGTDPFNLQYGYDVVDARGMNDKRYIAVWQPISGDAHDAQQVGLFDRQTGTTTFYPWGATWGESVPDGVQFGGITSAEDGGSIIAMNRLFNTLYEFDAWYFPLNVGPPTSDDILISLIL